MDFALSELQEMLRTSSRDFLKANCPGKMVRQMAKDEKGDNPELWRQMAEMGWMGLVIPEEYGGAGGASLTWLSYLKRWGGLVYPGRIFPRLFWGTDHTRSRKCGAKERVLTSISGREVAFYFGSDGRKRQILR